jgi:multiple sugar transport system permease protein
VAALIRLIDALKTFDEVLVISGGGPAGASETLYMYAYKVAFSYLSFGYVSAVLVLLFLAVLAASLVVVRLRRVAW